MLQISVDSHLYEYLVTNSELHEQLAEDINKVWSRSELSPENSLGAKSNDISAGGSIEELDSYIKQIAEEATAPLCSKFLQDVGEKVLCAVYAV